MLIDGLIDRMQAMLGPLQAAGDPRQYFHATYLRTTVATREQLRRGGFEDAGWVERWDVAFAGFYLDALQAAMAGRPPSRPWQIAFGAPPELPALRHVLLGMNAHINFDLPQAIVAVISAGNSGTPPCWPAGRPITPRLTACWPHGSPPSKPNWWRSPGRARSLIACWGR